MNAHGGKGDDFIGSRISFSEENDRFEINEFYSQDGDDGPIQRQPEGVEMRASYGR